MSGSIFNERTQEWDDQDKYSFADAHSSNLPDCQSPAQNDMGTRLIERAIERCQRDIQVEAYVDKNNVYTVMFNDLRADVGAIQEAVANSLGSSHIEIEVHTSDGYMTIVAY